MFVSHLDHSLRLHPTRLIRLQTNGRIAVMESTRGQLLEVLDQYTNLLNGTATGPSPDEIKVKALLNDSSLNSSLASFDTGLGGGRDSHGVLAAGNLSGAFGDLDWSSASVPRGLGAASVPLPSMSGINVSRERAHPVSAMGMPIGTDPFFTVDPFSTTDTAAGKTLFSASGTDKGFTEDPFGPNNLFTSSDPFKDLDPFGGDPFNLPTDKSKRPTNVDTSAFDPFSTATVNTSNHSQVAPTTITATDFDSVFGSSAVNTTGTGTTADPFEADPFGSLELAAFTGGAAPPFGGSNVPDALNSATLGSKKSPPPRPKTQPGAGRLGRERNSLGGSPEPARTLKSPNSLGNFSTASISKSGAFNSLGQSKHKSACSFSGRSRGGSMSTAGAGRSRKDSANSSSHQNRSNSFTSAGEKSINVADCLAPVGMSEEEQLSLATVESRRLAQAEEQARQQEQADLELAIRLSQMDATVT
ncbi:Epidermal growth factor receptor substrate 15 [Fasciola hepatica]|uniref:Epidermal growth factor receptor substrate 15 n=1 Tax=Fasciola hepatica TaxID=6192 RepID=A0A4E0RS33_FASHE|nr:Epidermal growth factor receptor substrate 15 [Fasciola hepatica]